MPGITIHDKGPDGTSLTFDVRDLLSVIDDCLGDSSWKITGLECFGDSANALHEIADGGRRVDGIKLRSLADGLTQTIDGDFYGNLNRSGARIMIRAVDSSCFDVETKDEELLARFRLRFSSIEEFPADISYLGEIL